jgi:hypothetical protein
MGISAFVFDKFGKLTYVQVQRAGFSEKVSNMAEERLKNEIGPEPPSAKRAYERSTIEFPYNDLDDAIDVVRAIHTNAGSGCTLDQLAAYLKQSMTSGAFRGRVSNAGTFRLTDNASGEVRLSELGRQSVDPGQEAAARADAFLSVPLYQAVYEKYKGYTLPPASALEREMMALGVAQKQTDKARQAFMRSARQAGFFQHGEDRLVRPAVGSGPGTKPIEHNKAQQQPNQNQIRTGGGSGGDVTLDPLLVALLKKIPPVEEGWPAAKRVRWFRTFAMNVSQIYDLEDDPIELSIELGEHTN